MTAMIRTVWKFELTQPVRKIDLEDARVVHVGIDPASDDPVTPYPTVWIEHRPPPDPTQVGWITLHVVGTGHPVPENTEHVGSCVTPAGLVWHIYQEVAR